MPIVSWNSFASVSAFDEALDRALRQSAARALETHAELVGVWLFGSRARGEAGARSDVDLLLLASRARPRMMDRLLDYGDLLEGIPAPVDLLVLTPQELADHRDEPFYRRLLREARPLACRDGATVPRELACT